MVYDTAKKLANEIKNSKEYKEFKKYMNEVKKDKESERLLKELKIAQVEIQNSMIENKPLDKKRMTKIERIQKDVSKNKKLQKYLECEIQFLSIMDNINRILAQSIEKDYK